MPEQMGAPKEDLPPPSFADELKTVREDLRALDKRRAVTRLNAALMLPPMAFLLAAKALIKPGGQPAHSMLLALGFVVAIGCGAFSVREQFSGSIRKKYAFLKASAFRALFLCPVLLLILAETAAYGLGALLVSPVLFFRNIAELSRIRDQAWQAERKLSALTRKRPQGDLAEYARAVSPIRRMR